LRRGKFAALPARTGNIPGNSGIPILAEPCFLFESGGRLIDRVFRICIHRVVSGRDLTVGVIQSKLFGLRPGRVTPMQPFTPSAFRGPVWGKCQQVRDVRHLHDLHRYPPLRTFIPRPSCLKFRFSNAPRFDCCDENLAASIISHRFNRLCEEMNIPG
jgi:hypothetical protein